MFLFEDNPGVMNVPKKVRDIKGDRVRMECVLQTVDVFNRNNRQYPSALLKEGVQKIAPRIKEGSLLGELDHPTSKEPIRQITVLYKEASHMFREMGWDGNKLTSVVDTLSTNNGRQLKALAKDGVAIGWSFRGMGDLKETKHNGKRAFMVQKPLHVVTWDAVSFPSHEGANTINFTELTESVKQQLMESVDLNMLTESNGMICLENGVCYYPNDFDMLVENRILTLKNKFNL